MEDFKLTIEQTPQEELDRIEWEKTKEYLFKTITENEQEIERLKKCLVSSLEREIDLMIRVGDIYDNDLMKPIVLLLHTKGETLIAEQISKALNI